MPKGVPNKRYTPEFKVQVIETMQKEKLIARATDSDRPVLSMVTGMLEKAFQVIPDGTNLVLHSD